MRDNVIKMVQASGAKNTGAISLDNDYSDPAQGAIMLKFATTNLPAGVTVADSSDPGTVTGVTDREPDRARRDTQPAPRSRRY